MKKRLISMIMSLCMAVSGISVAAVYGGLGTTEVMAAGKTPAFPGAEGGGKYATGGRGGTVYHVTNLNDSGTGSFRDAVSGSNRIVVFDVGGTIELKSDVVVKSNVTIAGQTAPGGHGVTLKNYKVGLGGSNIIMRYISSRPGERGLNQDYDALGGSDGANSIIDHCAFGWANDEQWGLYSNNDMYTTQWTIVGPSNCFSYHSKGIHGFGIMFGRSNNTWHHNLIAHNISRNFRGKVTGTDTAEFVNNVIYDWGYQTAYGTLGHLNYVGNYLKKGAKTTGDRYISISSGSGYENFRFYMNGNKLVDKNGTVVIDEGQEWDKGINYGSTYNKESFYSAKPFSINNNSEDVAYVQKAESADNAFVNVTSFVGPAINAQSRTKIDAQVIDETINGTGALTGARPLSEANSTQKAEIEKYGITQTTYTYPETVTKAQAGDKYTDTDNDGMPDWWELERGLDPYSNTKAETNGDYCGQGYTNIEYYLNDLTVDSFPAGTVTVSPTKKSDVTVDPNGQDSDAAGKVVRTTIAKAVAYIEASDSDGTKNIYIKNGTYNEDINIKIANVNIEAADSNPSVSVGSITVGGADFTTSGIGYKNVVINADKAVFTDNKAASVVLNKNVRAYFKDSEISGADKVITADNAQAVFEGCNITSAGTVLLSSTASASSYGVMFKDCTIKGTGLVTGGTNAMAAVYGGNLGGISGTRYAAGVKAAETGVNPDDSAANMSEVDFLNNNYGPYNFTKGSDSWNPGGWDTLTPQESLKAFADSIEVPSVVIQNTSVVTSFENDSAIKVEWKSDNNDRFKNNIITIGEYGEGSVTIHLTVTLSKTGLKDEVREFTVTVGSSSVNGEGVVDFESGDGLADSKPVEGDMIEGKVVDNIDGKTFADHGKFFVVDQSATTGENIHNFEWEFVKKGEENIKDAVYEASFDVYLSDISTDGYCEAFVRGENTISQVRFVESGGDYNILGYERTGGKSVGTELVTAGSQWYTVKMAADTTNLSSGTQPKVNYYLYDAEGNLLGSLKNAGISSDFDANAIEKYAVNRISFRPRRNDSKVKFYVDNLSFTNLTDLAAQDAAALNENKELNLKSGDTLPVFGAHMTDVVWDSVDGTEGIINADGTINYNKFATAEVKVKATVSAGTDLKGTAQTDVITLNLTGTGSGDVKPADPSFDYDEDFSDWNTQFNQAAVVDKADKTDVNGNTTTKIRLDDKAVFKVLDGNVGTGKVTFTADFLRAKASDNKGNRTFRIYFENTETPNASGAATADFATTNIIYHLMDVGDQVYSVTADNPTTSTAEGTDLGVSINDNQWYRVVVEADLDAKTATTKLYLHGADGKYAPDSAFDTPIAEKTTNLITKTPMQLKQIRLVRTSGSKVYFDNVSLKLDSGDDPGKDDPGKDDPVPPDLKLDVNGDENENIDDANEIIKFCLNRASVSEKFSLEKADANGDGEITALDAAVLQNKLREQGKI